MVLENNKDMRDSRFGLNFGEFLDVKELDLGFVGVVEGYFVCYCFIILGFIFMEC